MSQWKVKSHVFVYEDELGRLSRLVVAERQFQCQLCKVTGAIDLTSEKVTDTEEEHVLTEVICGILCFCKYLNYLRYNLCAN